MRLTQTTQTVLSRYANDFPMQGPSGLEQYMTIHRQLIEVGNQYQTLLLDGFGVLNVGNQAVPGMVEAISTLQRRGIRCIVLTNGATGRSQEVAAKFSSLGYELPEIVSSRDVLIWAMQQRGYQRVGFSKTNVPLDDMPFEVVEIKEGLVPDNIDAAVLLSTMIWQDDFTDHWVDSLQGRRLPIWCANPDLGAPFEKEVTVEPGEIALQVIARCGCEIEFVGKPFACTYDYVFSRYSSLDPSKTLMVGDTLHTDILGANRYGIDTALMLDYGYFAGDFVHWQSYARDCGIFPNYLITEHLP
ncbi:MAG: TIGR01459 family HAD-type hydrolase [Gammaproteobacteria bacterium]|nr:TIGR01459 family HAD-type hydrolase [Gammaproteobacteria bacterium]